jgi:hypothetical protein
MRQCFRLFVFFVCVKISFLCVNHWNAPFNPVISGKRDFLIEDDLKVIHTLISYSQLLFTHLCKSL